MSKLGRARRGGCRERCRSQLKIEVAGLVGTQDHLGVNTHKGIAMNKNRNQEQTKESEHTLHLAALVRRGLWIFVT